MARETSLLVRMETFYSCALVTGASSGLGEEFATQLAGRVGKLILIARREDRLEEIAAQLRQSHPRTAVVVIAADLSDKKERQAVADKICDWGFVPDLLVNNAGLGDYGEFVTAEWKTLEAMLEVNIVALTHLSHLFAPGMARKGTGHILNVSSLAATIPIPDFAVYAATKAYVSSFSEALRIELKESGVRVMSLCPGPVKTEFGQVAQREGTKIPAQEFFYVEKEQVVSEALMGLDRDRARVFPGLKVAAAGLLLGALPLVIIRLMMGSRPRR